MSTNLPAPRPRQTFPEISAVSWEHPADRAALQALRAIPGVDEVIRKTLAHAGRRARRPAALSGQRRPGRPGAVSHALAPAQRGRHHLRLAHGARSCTSPRRRSSTPAPTASISRSSCCTPPRSSCWTTTSCGCSSSHELGHVMSGHALYRTIAAILALISLGALPMLAGLAVLPIRLAFLEWSRKSELSADRAGLLGAQDIVAAQRLDMKMAGGGRGGGFAGQLNVDAFMQQAHEYAASGEGLDVVYKLLSTLALDPSDAHRAGGRAAALGGERRVRPHPARRVRPARPRDHATGRSRTTWAPPGATTPARPASSPTQRGRRRQARGRARPRRVPERAEVVRTPRGRRRGPGARALLGPPPGGPRGRPLLRPGQSRHRRARHQPSHSRRRLDRLADAADMHGIDLTIIGPEVPLARGLADRLRAEGRAVFGPGAAAAQIEASKAFAKDVMTAAGIPTAASRTFQRARRRRWPTSIATPSRWWSRRPGSPPARAPSSVPPGPRPPRAVRAMLGERRVRRGGTHRRDRGVPRGRGGLGPGRDRRATTSSCCRSPRTTSACSRATPDPTPAGWVPTARWRWRRRPLLDRARAGGARPGARGDAAPARPVHRRALRRAHGGSRRARPGWSSSTAGWAIPRRRWCSR